MFNENTQPIIGRIVYLQDNWGNDVTGEITALIEKGYKVYTWDDEKEHDVPFKCIKGMRSSIERIPDLSDVIIMYEAV